MPFYVKLILMMQKSALLSHGMKKRSVCEFILIENGVALWLLYFFVVMLSPGRFLYGGSKTQVTGHCFTNTGTALNLYCY